MNPIITVLPGAVLGLAVAFATAALVRPARLHLPAALARLDSRTHATGDHDEFQPGRVERLLIPVAVRAAHTTNRWWGIPTPDLDACEITPTRYIARRLAWAGGGVAAAAGLTAVSAAAGLGTPGVLGALFIVVGGVAGSAVPVLDVAKTARKRRAEFRQAIAPYLDLVAQERAAGAAATPALIEAAVVCSSWPFRRLHTTLIRAQHTGQAPWEALADLAGRMRVPELREVADIAATAADGAAVYTTLTATASGLRRAELATDKAAANAASQRLAVPAALLLVGLLMLAGYPALIRMLGG